MFKSYRDRQSDHDSEITALRIDRDNLARRLRDQISQSIELTQCIESVRNAWDEYVETDEPMPMILALEKAELLLQKAFHV